MALSNIFIIIDPSTARQPAFERGIESARDTGALLHIYLCDSSGNTDENESLMNALLAQAKEEGQEAVSELEFSDDHTDTAEGKGDRDADCQKR